MRRFDSNGCSQELVKSPDAQGLTSEPFYWMPIRRLAVLARLEPKIQTMRSAVVLDLEDSLWFPDDPIKTEAARASARLALVSAGPYLESLANRIRIGVRINPFPGIAFARDAAALARLGIGWEWIFLPKVSDGRSILQAAAKLAQAGVRYRSIVPILESESALDGIQEILAGAVHAGAQWIQYGHQDFSLSAGHWPFWEQDDPAFRAHVEWMVAAVEAKGLNYIHTPYMHMRDGEGFMNMRSWLGRICNRSHGQATLSMEQAMACRQDGLGIPSLRKAGGGAESPLEIARWILSEYGFNAHAGRSFSVDMGSGRFFSPQEYQAAQRFLERAAP